MGSSGSFLPKGVPTTFCCRVLRGTNIHNKIREILAGREIKKYKKTNKQNNPNKMVKIGKINLGRNDVNPAPLSYSLLDHKN